MSERTAQGEASPTTSGGMPPSPDLRQLIKSLIASVAVPAGATLSDVRNVVIADGIFVSGEGELLYPQDRTFLVIELDDLIDRYGPQAAASDFTMEGAHGNAQIDC